MWFVQRVGTFEAQSQESWNWKLYPSTLSEPLTGVTFYISCLDQRTWNIGGGKEIRTLFLSFCVFSLAALIFNLPSDYITHFTFHSLLATYWVQDKRWILKSLPLLPFLILLERCWRSGSKCSGWREGKTAAVMVEPGSQVLALVHT